jgi:hypothetical protein
MSLTDLASLGNFVSGIGVLISLLLLLVQLRQLSAQIRLAERNQLAAIQQDRYGRVFEANLAITEPTLAEAVAKGTVGARDMTLTQVSQYRGYVYARFQISENTFLQHKAGLLSDEAFEAFMKGFIAALNWPSTRVLWKWARTFHAAEFVAFVDGLMLQGPPPTTPDDFLSQWNSGLAAEEACTFPEH